MPEQGFPRYGCLSYFKTVRVDPELITNVWDNGADLAPEFLFEIGVPAAQAMPV